MPRLLRPFALAFAALAWSAPASADLQLDGRWRQSALREDFTVQQWLPNGCGPTPQSAATGGGEIIAIRMEGDELAFVGGGRVYRSNQCYDQMPTLARVAHSRDANGKTWRTRCTTPANDPRQAILNTLVVATTDTHIDVIETGRYEVVIESGRCVADVKRTRSYSLIQDEKPAVSAAPPPAPTVKEPPRSDPKPPACESPGDPSRLEVRPSKKLLRTGESFQFRPLVLDAKGCATKTPTTWKLAPGAPAGVTVDAKTGLVKIGGDVREGTVEIVATAADKDARVTIEVTSPARYDELLAKSDLNAAGETDVAAVATIGSLGAGESRVEDRAKTRRYTFVAIVGAVLVLLGVVATILARRSRKAKTLEREAEERHEAKVAEVLSRRAEREAEHAAQMRAHEESVAHRNAKVAEAAAARAAQRQRAEEAAKAAASLPHPATLSKPKRGKICPTCGDRFDGTADFCGKDGTQLVLLN
ncbi:MAG: hypothetical protein KF819_13515 [Labilithrix sp.]|nr:hypothetical protein [Labilithrix sp.]